jgi:fructuronate reductase
MPRILHFGLGNFHRAHQAWYTQKAGGWSITGVSLRSAAIRDALAPQNFDYTLVMRDASGTQDLLITVLEDVLVGQEDPTAVIAALVDPDTQVVTATVTEKAYHLNSAGVLNLTGLIADEITTRTPSSFIGYLAFGIAARQAAKSGPLTVISCDNLSHNGDKLKLALSDFANTAQLEIDFGQLSFPNTMVDRITPAPTSDLADGVRQRTGFADKAPIVTEVFSEWVIADDFSGSHPDWAGAGAEIVADVAAFEMRKLRMLNGAHSMLAYLGQLRGYHFVHEAIADNDLRSDIVALMQDAMQTLDFDRTTLEAYQEALLLRFENPSLAHALRQIAMDGSQKMPIRIIDTMRELDQASYQCEAHAKALASWVRYVSLTPDLDDPRAADLRAACATVDPVYAVLEIASPDLPETLQKRVKNHFDCI